MYIQKLKPKYSPVQPKIYTADFETIIKKNKHVLFAYSIYSDNLIVTKCYNPDEVSECQIAECFINNLTYHSKSKKIIVYMHNLGSFDGVILLNAIKNSK